MIEIWKDIDGYEGLYQVSNLGRVKSNKSTPSVILRPQRRKKYEFVALYDRGAKRKQWAVHRIVGAHFLPNPYNKLCINHKNGEHRDNRVSNLEWCTQQENSAHAGEVLGVWNKSVTAKNDKETLLFPSIRSAVISQYKFSRRNIHRSLQTGKKYRSYLWSYA